MKVQTASRSTFLGAAFLASAIMALTTGCASGGFKLTRQYAGFVNSQNIIIRIILYIFTSVVFVATLIIDAVIFNTMDFWSGRVSAGDYNFKEGDKTYFVRHENLQGPGVSMKQSTIRVHDLAGALVQTVVLKETLRGEIEMFVDGTLRTRVANIGDLPTASMFDGAGHVISQQVVVLQPTVAAR